MFEMVTARIWLLTKVNLLNLVWMHLSKTQNIGTSQLNTIRNHDASIWFRHRIRFPYIIITIRKLSLNYLIESVLHYYVILIGFSFSARCENLSLLRGAFQVLVMDVESPSRQYLKQRFPKITNLGRILDCLIIEVLISESFFIKKNK